MSQHVWASDQALASLSRDLIGAELAKNVAERLIMEGDESGLWFSHKDYCGHGLIYSSDQFFLIEIYDGYAEYSSPILAWKDKEEFCSWLCEQSDFSLSGADDCQPELLANSSFDLNNQRLTKQRMVDYVACGRR